jgi:hypothetical protein|nr:hypothetical protein Q903MT_gene2190 [Picea sitchensis]
MSEPSNNRERKQAEGVGERSVEVGIGSRTKSANDSRIHSIHMGTLDWVAGLGSGLGFSMDGYR